MKETTLLTSRSIPAEIPEEEFKKIGYELIDRIAGLFSGMSERPVTNASPSEHLNHILRQEIQLEEQGQDPGLVLQKASDLLMENSLYNGHPKFWGYITSAPTPIGVLGDLLASAINANVGAWMLSPMATEIEKQTIEWIAQFMRYPAGGGLLLSGGNAANHVGFLAALRAKAGSEIRTQGFRGLSREFRAYCSQETHTWIQKSADLSGLGTDSIRWIKTDANGQMDLQALESAILNDLQNGFQPFMVVGTAGSVSTGVIDLFPAFIKKLGEEVQKEMPMMNFAEK